MIKNRIIALALCLSFLMTNVSPLSLAYGITDNINNIEQVQSDVLETGVSDPASDEVEDQNEALDDSAGEEILDDYNLDDEEETSGCYKYSKGSNIWKRNSKRFSSWIVYCYKFRLGLEI